MSADHTQGPVRSMQSAEQGMRINQTTFAVCQFVFLGLAILAAGVRIALRLKTTKRLSVDDVILIFAVLCLTADIAVFYRSLDLVYTIFGTDDAFEPHRMLVFSQLIDACAVLSWTTIFAVKISFVWFFRVLVDRLPRMKLYWKIVLGIVIACAPINMFMTFFICSNFTLDLGVCAEGIDYRTSVYMNLTAALDIFTDLLIMSVPIALIWKVKINLRRKLALATVLCLSTFMVIIEIVRVSLAYIPNETDASGEAKVGGVPSPANAVDHFPRQAGPPPGSSGGGPPSGMPSSQKQLDQSWMFFWLSIEASVAIIMVALTAFRSMLGRHAESKRGYTPYKAYPGPARAPLGKPNSKDDAKNEIVNAEVYNMGDWTEGGRSESGYIPDLKEKPEKDEVRNERSWYREEDRDGRPF